MDAMAQKMFTAYKKQKAAQHKPPVVPAVAAKPKAAAAAVASPKLAPEEAKPPTGAASDHSHLKVFEPPSIKKPAALAGKSDADLDKMAASMMKHMDGGSKSKKASLHVRTQQLWSAQEDVDANAQAAKDAKLLKSLNSGHHSLVKASKNGHHTVSFDMKALLGKKDCDKKDRNKKGCKKQSVDQLAQQMMKKLDKSNGKLGKVKAVTVASAMALPPDIAAAVNKLKKSN